LTRILRDALIALIPLMMTGSVEARDCSKSKPFQLGKPQVLSGTMQDPSGAVLPGIAVQLLSGKKVVRRLRTDNLGAYDFGEIPSGKYRIRVDYPGKAFCAPEVRCAAEGCSVNSTLKANPKNMVMVE
jgi:hypothetical protein